MVRDDPDEKMGRDALAPWSGEGSYAGSTITMQNLIEWRTFEYGDHSVIMLL